MAARIAIAGSSPSFGFGLIPFLGPKLFLTSPFAPCITQSHPILRSPRTSSFTVCFIKENHKFETEIVENNSSINYRPLLECTDEVIHEQIPVMSNRVVEERMDRKRSDRFTYLVAIMSTFGITSLASMAVYYRFSWQMEGGEIPYLDMFGTFALSIGATVAMEYWSRWAHEVLWHASLWRMHQSHHKPREGPFELNDVFAILNAVPAIVLLSYGFFHKGIFPGLCFGVGLGITMIGMAYVFVHDGMVHKRFPVGPIANVPYLRKVAAAHQLHHTQKFNGIPYGFFLGPKEVEEVGAYEELEKEINRRMMLLGKS